MNRQFRAAMVIGYPMVILVLTICSCLFDWLPGVAAVDLVAMQLSSLDCCTLDRLDSRRGLAATPVSCFEAD